MFAYLTLAAVMLFWAGNAIIGRAIRDDIPPFTLAAVRWIGALALLLPIATRRLAADLPAVRAHWRPLLLLGVFGVAGFNAFLYAGLHYTTATNSLLIQAAIPAVVLLLDRLLFGVRSAAGQVVGVLLSTIGVALIVLQGDIGLLLDLRFGTGDLLVLGGVAVWALYTSLLRLRPAIHPLSFLMVTFGVGAVCMAPLAAIEAIQGKWRYPDADVLAACAYVAIFPSVISYLLYNAAVERIGAGMAGQTIALMPLFGAALAVLLLGEQLHRYHLAGMAIILAGIVLTAVMARRKPV